MSLTSNINIIDRNISRDTLSLTGSRKCATRKPRFIDKKCEEVTRQIKVVFDPLTQLERLCDLIREVKEDQNTNCNKGITSLKTANAVSGS